MPVTLKSYTRAVYLLWDSKLAFFNENNSLKSL